MNIQMILKEEKMTFRIKETEKKDGTQGKKIVYIIFSNEKLLDGKEYKTPTEAAIEILNFKNPLSFGRKDNTEKQREAIRLSKKILEVKE